MRKRSSGVFGAGAMAVLVGLWWALPATGPVIAGGGQQGAIVPVTDAMLRDPDPADWLMVHRTYDFQGFSPLDQINRDNVAGLRLAWMRAMDEGAQEIRPLVHDGVMYIAHPGSDHLQALDAATGDLVWDYERQLPDDLRQYAQLGGRTRHVALYGRHVYHLTADSHLVAIDARTGEQAWESRLADYREGITHSSGAMVINGMVVSGRTCSPGSLEARCFIAGHDAETGVERWRTYTAAGADDPGGDTWGDLPTAQRVHVSPWGLPGSYDPELNRIFWGIAVPLPYPRIVRRGTWDVGDRTPCELYSNSTLAMNADTGAIDWYYQHLPCDDWDQDFVQERTLIDTVVNPDPEAVRWINPKLAGTAEERKVVVVMGEPGGLFVNDRETGEFLWASPLPYTSTERFVIRDIDVETGAVYINMDLVAREVGQRFVICGHNVKGWWSWSYSPVTGMLYIPFNRSCLDQTANDRTVSGASPRFTIPEPGLEEDGDLTEVRAIDMSTGREAWRYSQRAPNAGSTLATAGNVVFFGDLNRRLRAFDAETGDVLWETILGSQITGYPVTYAVDGRQYVTVPVGGVGNRLASYAPELEAPVGSNMLVTFTLP
ncbi:MAG: PQQ-binding-like beta-propeller repeat protein [Acidobacteria bacterium]|nr:PQQ-binding-like beta-propeller repeat protein [Acidobacteriota bacterium]